ncbi:RNA polymerase recycling motor HelD [Lutispora thermophila]|uniref:DNA 3'-5' helicase n=1 Tax=Lutispora thermophila DSM 19022 TaxID=1122184 RepID=A0A1M6C9M0_9FIRM|nr:RNA polymerase recycling motor HelD [Lutispora thermophila]SHI57696.1 ATP-dependent DNA helicase, Rep family [Lutispora thermophila DSM 19022]
MKINDYKWIEENKWLDVVLKEAYRQLDEKRELCMKLRMENIEIQRQLWEEIGSISIESNLDQLVDFMSFIDIIKRQKRTYSFIKKIEKKYERIVESPYFGRFDFIEDGNNNPEKYYIGIANLINNNCDILVYDWRAPVSSIFYDYEIGEGAYNCPEGIIKGKVILKRQYKISNGKLEYMFDSNLKIDDEILQEVLGRSCDNRMKTIVTSIQREQNKIIRNEEYKYLIVQGPAGSGKTSIALHRVAYLLYKHRNKVSPENIIIFSPNRIFNDYISDVLPQLGEDNMIQTTFKEYMHKALDCELKKEDYYDMMEYILTSKDEPCYQKRIQNIKFKSSIEFANMLKKYAAYVAEGEKDFNDIYFSNKLIISSDELKELYYNDYSRLSLKNRLDKIRRRIMFLLKPHVEEKIKEISGKLADDNSGMDEEEIMKKAKSSIRDELKDVHSEIDRMTKFEIVEIYKHFIEKMELFLVNKTSEKIIDEVKIFTMENLKAGQLYYEDQIPMLYLKISLGELPKTSDIKYVIIDEAQDYTPLQYEILYQLFKHANITMLGDLNQAINPYMNVGDYNNISHLFPKDSTCIMNLTKSYRSTMEIAKFTRKILKNESSDEFIERPGDEPLILGFSQEEEINKRIIEDVEKYKNKGYKSIGIITRTKKEANDVYSRLKNKIFVKTIIDENEEFKNDVVIIPSYLAKGLEFDVVIIYNAGDGNYNCEEERLLFYTACTRALHILCVYYLKNSQHSHVQKFEHHILEKFLEKPKMAG